MKKILTFTAIVMIGLAAFSGCKKSSDSPSYNMSASVGGTAFSANYCVADTLGGALMIMAFNGTGYTATPPDMIITITSYTGMGTYNFDSLGVTNIGQYNATASTSKESIAGSVVISSTTSTQVVGTFSFTCSDGTVVSSGKFTAQKY